MLTSVAMTDLATLLGHHGADAGGTISGPYTQTRDGRSITLWATSACIDCDQSRENCPAVYRHAAAGQTEIDATADFFAHIGEVKRALDNCPTNALGLRVE